MSGVRAVLASLLLAAVATSAAAQIAPPNLNAIELQDLRYRLEAAERADVRTQNDLMALEARSRAQAAVSDLKAQRDLPTLAPQLRYEPQPPALSAGQLKYPSMPDAALADSNRRVQAAASNRR